MDNNIPLKGAAVLVWLPEGVNPSDDSFDPDNVQPPPDANPEPWWLAYEAIQFAATTVDTFGKVPWIKIGDQILDRRQIMEIAPNIGQPNWR